MIFSSMLCFTPHISHSGVCFRKSVIAKNYELYSENFDFYELQLACDLLSKESVTDESSLSTL